MLVDRQEVSQKVTGRAQHVSGKVLQGLQNKSKTNVNKMILVKQTMQSLYSLLSFSMGDVVARSRLRTSPLEVPRRKSRSS